VLPSTSQVPHSKYRAPLERATCCRQVGPSHEPAGRAVSSRPTTVAPEAARPVAAALSSWVARVGGSEAGPMPTTPNVEAEAEGAGDVAGLTGVAVAGGAGLVPGVAGAAGGEVVAGAPAGVVEDVEVGEAADEGEAAGGGDAGALAARAEGAAPKGTVVAARTSAVREAENRRGRITRAMLGRFEGIVNNPLGDASRARKKRKELIRRRVVT